MKQTNKQKGVILYLSIVIMAILLAIALGTSAIILGQIKTIKGMGDSVRAFYAADTGIERILYENKLCWEEGCSATYCITMPDCAGLINEANFTDSVAGYDVTAFTPGLSGCPNEVLNYCLRSNGTYKNTRRAIEASF